MQTFSLHSCELEFEDNFSFLEIKLIFFVLDVTEYYIIVTSEPKSLLSYKLVENEKFHYGQHFIQQIEEWISRYLTEVAGISNFYSSLFTELISCPHCQVSSFILAHLVRLLEFYFCCNDYSVNWAS